MTVSDPGGDVLREILRGGADVAAAAGIAVVGGHSIDDPEPKYGMSVTGTVHPDELISNAGARVGDLLVLTKPLGVGPAGAYAVALPEEEREALRERCRANLPQPPFAISSVAWAVRGRV